MSIELQSFPRDNTTYNASDMGLFMATRTRGVFSADDNLKVAANNDMSVTIKKGIGWNKNDDWWGLVVGLKADATLQVDLADGTLNRIDSVVLRSDLQLNTDYIFIAKGELAQNPVAPVPVRDANYQDLILAHLHIDAGLAFITQVQVDDTRMETELCGIMSDGVTGIPTDTLLEDFYRWFDEIQEKAETDLNNLVTNFDTTLESKLNELDAAIDVRMLSQIRPCTINQNNWSLVGEYYQATVSVANVTPDSNLIVSLPPSIDEDLEAQISNANFKAMNIGNGAILFRANEVLPSFSPQILEVF